MSFVQDLSLLWWLALFWARTGKFLTMINLLVSQILFLRRHHSLLFIGWKSGFELQLIFLSALPRSTFSSSNFRSHRSTSRHWRSSCLFVLESCFSHNWSCDPNWRRSKCSICISTLNEKLRFWKDFNLSLKCGKQFESRASSRSTKKGVRSLTWEGLRMMRFFRIPFLQISSSCQQSSRVLLRHTPGFTSLQDCMLAFCENMSVKSTSLRSKTKVSRCWSWIQTLRGLELEKSSSPVLWVVQKQRSSVYRFEI